jgi:hypothetical protein
MLSYRITFARVLPLHTRRCRGLRDTMGCRGVSKPSRGRYDIGTIGLRQDICLPYRTERLQELSGRFLEDVFRFLAERFDGDAYQRFRGEAAVLIGQLQSRTEQ